MRLSTEVAAIDPAAHAIELVGGERIEYGRLALATAHRAQWERPPSA